MNAPVSRHYHLKTSHEMNSTVEFESILTFMDQIFWSTGFKIFDGLWDTKYRRIHRYFTLVLFGISPIFAIQFFIQNFSTATIMMIVKSLIIISASSQAVFKMLFLCFCYNDLLMLFQTAREFRVKCLNDDNSINLINGYSRVTKLVLRAMRNLTLVGVIIFLAFPLLSGGIEDYELPFPIKLPFIPLEGTGYYLINYMYQIYGASGNMIFVIGVDGILLMSITETCLQLDVLTMKLGTLGVKHSANTLDLNSLKTIHNHHLDCLSYINSAKNVYAKLVLMQLATCCLLLCTFMYTLAKADAVTELPAVIVYILVVLSELCLYCMCGQMMTDKVHDLTTMMYDSEWYNLSLTDQKSLIIIMSRTQEEVYISAMGFNLSLKNFVSVMKTAYSYYTIMRGMDT